MRTQIFIEALDLSEATINADNRVINGVVLIRAGKSANNRRYSESVLQNAASVFENSKAYANHPSRAEAKDRPERSIRDITGWYQNVRYESGRLIADRYFTRTQAGQDAWAIAEDVISQRAPANLAGLSINAVGTGKVVKEADGDVLEVESITHAISVDDVSSPAAGGGYVLVAANGDELTNAFWESLTFEDWFESKPQFVKRLQTEMKTIRQDDAIKAAKAEADRNIQALHDAQQAIQALEAEREAARQSEAEARRELAIERALAKAQLPASWKADLRQQLQEADTEAWSVIIEREIKKAKSAGSKVTVTGAGQQVQTPIETTESQSLLPLPGEDAEAWSARLARRK